MFVVWGGSHYNCHLNQEYLVRNSDAAASLSRLTRRTLKTRTGVCDGIVNSGCPGGSTTGKLKNDLGQAVSAGFVRDKMELKRSLDYSNVC